MVIALAVGESDRTWESSGVSIALGLKEERRPKFALVNPSVSLIISVYIKNFWSVIWSRYQLCEWAFTLYVIYLAYVKWCISTAHSVLCVWDVNLLLCSVTVSSLEMSYRRQPTYTVNLLRAHATTYCLCLSIPNKGYHTLSICLSASVTWHLCERQKELF